MGISLPAWIITVIGFTAQVFFAGRTIIQWIKSEKAGRVLSPSSYWILSVLGAYTMFLYGVLRSDFAIIFGQLISYFIYLWNLNAKGIWTRFHKVLRAILILTPFSCVALLLKDAGAFFDSFFRNPDVPWWLLVFGSAGQVIFTLRFIYQWVYSHHKGESTLPAGFWIISLIGSGIIIAYGIFRSDIVLILGQSFGFLAYIRNIIIGFKARDDEKAVQ